jgi:hypothetical protein
MAEIATEQTELAFETEDARIAAATELPETPDNMGKLDAIMSAPIRAKDASQSIPAATPQPVSTPAPVVAPKTSGITLKDGDIEISYANDEELRKGALEKEKLIRRQTEFIKKNLTQKQPDGDMSRQLAELQRELATLKAPKTTPTAPQVTTAPVNVQISASQSRLKDIRAIQDELDEAEDQFDPDIMNKQRQCSRMITDEMSLMHDLLAKREQEIGEVRQAATSTRDEISGYRQTEEAKRQAERNQQALMEELKGIDSFCNNKDYPEFKMVKTSAEVENDYLAWGADVASIYYGTAVDVRTQDGFNKMKYTLNMLQKEAPDLLEKCKIAGVAVKPEGDIAKYLEVCELLDWRDGLRINPVTGQKEQITRYHSPSGKDVPDTYPSLEAAYEHRKIVDGVYAKKVQDAYKNGGTDAIKALGKRDGGAVELDNATGVSSVDAGTTMSKQQAMEFINAFDERTTDQAQIDKFNEAQRVMSL